MAFFGRGSSSSETKESAVAQRIKTQTAQEIATADVNELVNNMTRDCFDLCFGRDAATMAQSQAHCNENCANKFMAAWNLTSQVYVQRLQQSS